MLLRYPQVGADQPCRRSEPRSVSLADGHKIALILGLISSRFSGRFREKSRHFVSSAKMQRANFAMFQQLVHSQAECHMCCRKLANIENKPLSVSRADCHLSKLLRYELSIY